MTSEGIAPSTLREQLDAVGADINAGEATGYLELETKLNLNALAIGLGLENIAYEPEQFPGLIYQLEEPQATVVLFGTGVITTVDGANEQAVTDAITATVERAEELGLLNIGSTPSVNVDIKTIPITEELEGKE